MCSLHLDHNNDSADHFVTVGGAHMNVLYVCIIFVWQEGVFICILVCVCACV